MPSVDIRKGMPSVELSREEFERRYRTRFRSSVRAHVQGRCEDPGKGLVEPRPK